MLLDDLTEYERRVIWAVLEEAIATAPNGNFGPLTAWKPARRKRWIQVDEEESARRLAAAKSALDKVRATIPKKES
jgi:hypothetical protein